MCVDTIATVAKLFIYFANFPCVLCTEAMEILVYFANFILVQFNSAVTAGFECLLGLSLFLLAIILTIFI